MGKKTARRPSTKKTKTSASAPRARAGSKAANTAARAQTARKGAKLGKTPRPALTKVAVASRAPKRIGHATRPKAIPRRTERTPVTRRHASVIEPSGHALAQSEALAAKPEPALTREDVELFRQMLFDKRAEILGDVSTLNNEALNKNRREASGDLSSMPIHMADLGTDNYEMEFTLGLIEGERALLKEIDEALERVRLGTYGVCMATGKPIGKARLRAKPWARYCYEYTLAQEKGQQRRV